MVTLTFVINIMYRSESPCALFFVNVNIMKMRSRSNINRGSVEDEASIKSFHAFTSAT